MHIYEGDVFLKVEQKTKEQVYQYSFSNWDLRRKHPQSTHRTTA